MISLLRIRAILGRLMAGLVIAAAASGSAWAMDKMTVAGWSKPISEITNLLAEPDKGFFKAKGIQVPIHLGVSTGPSLSAHAWYDKHRSGDYCQLLNGNE